MIFLYVKHLFICLLFHFQGHKLLYWDLNEGATKRKAFAVGKYANKRTTQILDRKQNVVVNGFTFRGMTVLFSFCPFLTLLHSEKAKIVYSFGLSECSVVNRDQLSKK